MLRVEGIGKKSVNRSSGAKKLDSKTIDGKGGVWEVLRWKGLEEKSRCAWARFGDVRRGRGQKVSR